MTDRPGKARLAPAPTIREALDERRARAMYEAEHAADGGARPWGNLRGEEARAIRSFYLSLARAVREADARAGFHLIPPTQGRIS